MNFPDNSILCYLLSLYYTLKLFVLSYVINGISFTSKWAIEMQIYRIGVYILVNFEFSEVSCHDSDVQSFGYIWRLSETTERMGLMHDACRTRVISTCYPFRYPSLVFTRFLNF